MITVEEKEEIESQLSAMQLKQYPLSSTVEEKRRIRVARLRDIQFMKNFREPRGFGFVQYYDPDAAADAKYYMDRQLVLGRAITVVFAEENRKKPQEMRARDRVRGRSYDRRYSRSRSPRYSKGRSPSRSPSYFSRSPSPPNAKHRLRERSYSQSPVDSRSRSRSPYEERYGRSARRERSLSGSG